MCIICNEWQKGSMTSKEALANIGEMIGDPNNSEEDMEHLLNLSGKIVDKEIPFIEWDSDESTGVLDELDKAFTQDGDEVNLNDYIHLKKDIQKMFLVQGGTDIVRNYTMVGVCCHVPVIVCAFFVGEMLNWPPQLLINIDQLINDYSYKDIVGIPDSYPGVKV